MTANAYTFKIPDAIELDNTIQLNGTGRTHQIHFRDLVTRILQTMLPGLTTKAGKPRQNMPRVQLRFNSTGKASLTLLPELHITLTEKQKAFHTNNPPKIRNGKYKGETVTETFHTGLTYKQTKTLWETLKKLAEPGEPGYFEQGKTHDLDCVLYSPKA